MTKTLVFVIYNFFQAYENLKEQFHRLKVNSLGLVEFNFDSERFRDFALAPSVGAQVSILLSYLKSTPFYKLTLNIFYH